MNFTWATRTDPWKGSRSQRGCRASRPGTNGTDDHLVAAIADGMGGHAGGEIASGTAIATVAAVAGDAAIRIEAANLAVLDAASQRPRLTGMGTTLTLGIFESDGSLQMGHVGDSRAYMLRAGDLARMTTDHSFVSEMLAAGRMTEAEAAVHPYQKRAHPSHRPGDCGRDRSAAFRTCGRRSSSDLFGWCHRDDRR